MCPQETTSHNLELKLKKNSPYVKIVCLPISKARWKAGSDSQGNFVARWGGGQGGGRGKRVRKIWPRLMGKPFTQPMQPVQ